MIEEIIKTINNGIDLFWRGFFVGTGGFCGIILLHKLFSIASIW